MRRLTTIQFGKTSYMIEYIGELDEITITQAYKYNTPKAKHENGYWWKPEANIKSIQIIPFTVSASEPFSSSDWREIILPGLNEAHKTALDLRRFPKKKRRKLVIDPSIWEVARWIEANKEYQKIMGSQRSDLGFNKGVELWFKEHPDDKRSKKTLKRLFRQVAHRLPRMITPNLSVRRKKYNHKEIK